MKGMLQIGILLLVLNTVAFAQQPGDYRTLRAGSWQDENVWERLTLGGWIATDSYPNDSTANVFLNHAVSTVGDVTVRNITLDETLHLVNTLNVYGAIIKRAGSINGADGILRMSGSSAQEIPAGSFLNNSVKKLYINSGGTVRISDTLRVTHRLRLERGTVFTNNRLWLASDANYTASLEPVPDGAGITGNLIVEKYVPGKRVFHFFNHPFDHSIGLSQLMDDIDITGLGGSANGFTTTQTNNPSAFWYDVTKGNPTPENSNDPGWTAFSSTNGVGENAWNPMQAARVFVRGSKGEGLNTLNYTPSAVTIDIEGRPHTGPRSYTLKKGPSSNYNFIGNPYPSPVNLSSVYRNSSLAPNFYMWDGKAGTTGIYIAWPFRVPYGLPAATGIFIEATEGDNAINFDESDKYDDEAPISPVSSDVPAYVNFTITDTSNTLWDRLFIIGDSTAVDGLDGSDATKFNNTVLNFYSYNDQQKFAIDARNIQGDLAIPLGITTPVKGTYNLNVESLNLERHDVYLYDRYTNITQGMNAIRTYTFEVNNDTASYGNYRFVVYLSAVPEEPYGERFVIRVDEQGAEASVNWDWTSPFVPTEFYVERSPDGLSWNTLDSITANGGLSYQYSDRSPVTGRSYYRVKATLSNGMVTESNIYAFDYNPQSGIVILQNPTQNKTVAMKWNNLPKDAYNVTLVNSAGQAIGKHQIQHAGGTSNYTVNFANANNGIYSLYVEGKTRKVERKVVLR